MNDEDFWKLVYLLVLYKTGNENDARAVANEAMEHHNDRWVNESWA